MLEEILAYNKQFVENKGYESYITNKYPDKKIAILSCMDTRLTALLPAALGIKNGDVKMIKNAGGVISHPFGSVIRSLLVAIFELGVEEIMVIAHSDCGACHLPPPASPVHTRRLPIADRGPFVASYLWQHSCFDTVRQYLPGTRTLAGHYSLRGTR